MDTEKIIEFAPVIIVILLYIRQNNLFVKPEQLEKKHREITKETNEKLQEYEKDIYSKLIGFEEKIGHKYVEINAYKEFQNRVYAELEQVASGINELKDFLMKN